MYILYGGPPTRALMVEMVLAEGDLAYELRPVDIRKGEHRAADYLSVNPAGWVPALTTPEGDTLYETPAINLYLAERHRLTHLVPGTDDPLRGRFLSGFFYLTDELEPIMKRHFYPHRFVIRPEDSAAMKERSLNDALDRIGVIEQRLNEVGPYHLGDRFCLVDLVMTYWATYLDLSDMLTPYPSVRKCMGLVMDRPKLRKPFDRLTAEG